MWVGLLTSNLQAVLDGSSATINWNETETGSGVASRALQRQRAAAASESECAAASYSNDGASVDQPSPVGQPDLAGNYYCYRWRLSATDNVGNTSLSSTSNAVFVAALGPATPDVTASGTGVHQAAANAEIFFRPQAAATLMLTSTGVGTPAAVSHTFSALTSTTGWSPTNGATVNEDPAQRQYSFSSSATSTSLEVTANNAEGSSPARQVTITADELPPVTAFNAPAEGGPAMRSSTSFTVNFSVTDAGAGVASWSLQRQLVAASSGTRPDNFTNGGSPVTGTSSGSALTSGQSLSSGNCYRWVLSAGDRVGNASGPLTSGMVLIDTSAPPVFTISNDAASVASAHAASPTATTIYFRPAGAGTVTLTSNASDPHSGISSHSWTPASAPGWTLQSTNGSTRTYSYSASAGELATSATAINGSGLSRVGPTINFVVDDTPPLVSNILVVPDDFSATISWSESDAGAGVAAGSTSLQRQRKPATGQEQCSSGGYVDDGEPEEPASSPVTQHYLEWDHCYRWLISARDVVGNSGSTPTLEYYFAPPADPNAPGRPDVVATGTGIYQSGPNAVIYFRPDLEDSIALSATSDPGSTTVASQTFSALRQAIVGESTLKFVAASAGGGSAGLALPDGWRPGDLAVAWRWNTCCNIGPAPAGWTQIAVHNGWPPVRAIYKILEEGDTGIFPGHSSVENIRIHVYRGHHPLTPTGASGSISGSASVPYFSSFDFVVNDGSSWAAGGVSVNNGQWGAGAVFNHMTKRTTAPRTMTGDTAGGWPGFGFDRVSVIANESWTSLAFELRSITDIASGWTPINEATFGDNPAQRTYAYNAGALSVQLDVTAKNPAGVMSPPRTVSMTADRLAPAVEELWPVPGTSVVGAAEVRWTEIEDGSGVATRAVQRQRKAATGVSQCSGGSYTNDGPIQQVDEPRLSEDIQEGEFCYRWLVTLTDRVGNVSPTYTSGAVFVNSVSASIASAPRAAMGSEAYAIVTMRDLAGDPTSAYNGTITVSTSDPAAVFPDGKSYTFKGRADETGANVRILFGTPGEHTISVSGPSLTVLDQATVEVAPSELTISAPATVHQGVYFSVHVRPLSEDRLATGYAGTLTFSSSDQTITVVGTDGALRSTIKCGCEDGRKFATRLSELGLQTVSVSDQFGNSVQLTVNVVEAPPALPNPFLVYAVQWSFGDTVDFYIDPGDYQGSYRVLATNHNCMMGLRNQYSFRQYSFTGYGQFTSEQLAETHCHGGIAPYNGHNLVIVDDEGQNWIVPAIVNKRFSQIPDNSRWRMIDAGDPLASLVNTDRAALPVVTKFSWAKAPVTGNPLYWNFVPFGATVQIEAHEPTRIWSVGYLTDYAGDFYKGICDKTDIGSDYCPSTISGQTFHVASGQSTIRVDDIHWACGGGNYWTNPRMEVRYRDYNGRHGSVIVQMPLPPSDGTEWCESMHPRGPSPWPNAKRVEVGAPMDGRSWFERLADGAREWLEGDPVDPYAGAYLHPVTDFALGGLAPSLELSRNYNSQLAEAMAAGGQVPASLFGAGWSSNLDWALVGSDGDPTVTVFGDTGRLTFTRQADGSYRAHAAPYELTKLAAGWELTTSSGGGRRFDDAGRLVAIFSPHGHELTLNYQAGRLASFTDAVGRTASVTTDDAGRVTRVDLPDGRHVAFTYTGNFLATQRTLDGQLLTFVSDARGRVTHIRDGANNTLLRNWYDGRGRVWKQNDALGEPSFFVYSERTPTDYQLTRFIGPRGGVTTSCFAPQGGSLIGQVDAEGGLRTWTYDSRGNPTSATDEAGGVTRYEYNAKGQPAKVWDELGRLTTINYNGAGQISSIVDHTGTTISTSYAAGLPQNANVTKGANSLQVASYSYDPVTRLPRFVSGPPGTGTAELQYDSRGYSSATIDAEGRRVTMVTDARGLVTSVVSPEGNAPGGNPSQHTTTLTYDAMGRVLSVTNPLNQTTTFTYDEFGRPLSETSPLGFTTSYTYDLAGQLRTVTEQITASTSATTTYEYDPDGNLSAVVDAEGRRTEYQYDLVGRLIKTIDQAGKSWKTEYDPTGRILRTIDPTGRPSGRLSWDAAGRVLKAIDPAGLETLFTYTAADLIETVTDPAGNTTTYGYDWLGRQTSVTNAKSETSSVTYDHAGRLTSATDGRGKTISYEYDLTGLLTKVIEPGNIQTTFSYDAAGRLKTRTNERGATETYHYDRLGRPLKSVDTLANEWQTFYDDDGRVSHTIDANGQTTQFTYDRMGRPLTITPANGPQISRVYDKTDRLLSMSDGNGTTSFTYDEVGRLKSASRAGRTTGYNYDSAGRLLSVVYPAGMGTVSYGYDTIGRLATLTDWANRTTSFSYDQFGRPGAVSRPGNLVSTPTYDQLNRIVSVSHVRSGQPLLTLGYGYDAAGNLTSYTDDLGTATFAYDDLNRLSTAAYPGDEHCSYVYDSAGNILSATTSAGTRSYTYDLADRITSAGPGGAPAEPIDLLASPTFNAASGVDGGWTDPLNAYAEPDYASALLAPSTAYASDFSGFDLSAIPSGSAINSVTADLVWARGGENVTLGAQLLNGANLIGTETTAQPALDTDVAAQVEITSGITPADLEHLGVRVRASRDASSGGSGTPTDLTAPPTANTASGANGGWTNPANAYAEPDYATASMSANTSYASDFAGFDFRAVPADATINSVIANVTWSRGHSSVTLGAQLLNDGSPVGTESIGTPPINSDSAASAGVETGFSPADLATDRLAVRVRASRGSGGRQPGGQPQAGLGDGQLHARRSRARARRGSPPEAGQSDRQLHPARWRRRRRADLRRQRQPADRRFLRQSQLQLRRPRPPHRRDRRRVNRQLPARRRRQPLGRDDQRGHHRLRPRPAGRLSDDPLRRHTQVPAGHAQRRLRAGRRLAQRAH